MERLRAAIVGCGQIARVHVSALSAAPAAQLIAVCDRDVWRARDLAEYAGGGVDVYTDLADLLSRLAPDVVHVTTPPDTHAALAIQALESGSHVLVEKPMALTNEQAQRMIQAARENNRTLSCDHNYLLKPSVSQALQMVAEGAVGQVLYVHGYYGVSGDGEAYNPASPRSHWAWRLPGSAFTNLLPHLIYLLRAFAGDIEDIASLSLLPHPTRGRPPTELTAQIVGARALGTMVLSMRAKPYAKYVDIVGTKGTIRADLASEICIARLSSPLPGKVARVVHGLGEGTQIVSGTLRNVAKVALGRMRGYAGLHALVRDLYDDLANGKTPAVTAEDGAATVAVLEKMAAIIDAAAAGQDAHPERPAAPVASADAEPATPAERRFSQERPGARVLVTGANGFLGRHLVDALSRCSARVTALVRDRSRISPELEQRAEIVQGDLRDAAHVSAAMRGVDLVFHCAAVTSNKDSWRVHQETNVQGSDNVFTAAAENGVSRLVHVSSVIVYGLDGHRNGAPLDETAPYADGSDRWAHYMRSKTLSDQRALEMACGKGLPVTVLRLGILYGPGSRRLPGSGLMRAGKWRFVLLGGRNSLPYTYVRNAVDALLLAAIAPEATGRAYNIVDEPAITVREAARLVDTVTGDRVAIVPVPALPFMALARVLEWRSADGTKPPRITRYVLRSACRNLHYDVSSAKQDLGWEPATTLAEGLKSTIGDDR